MSGLRVEAALDWRSHAVASAPRLSFRRVLSAEYIKLLSLSSSYWSLLIGIAGFVILGVAVASGSDVASDFATDTEIVRSKEHSALTVGVALGQIIVAIMSLLIVTSEFTSGSIRVSLAAVPKRWPVLAAKSIAAASYAAVLALGGLLGTLAVTAPMFAAKGYPLAYFDPFLWPPLLYSVVYLMMIAVMNVAIGALVRSTVVGIVVMLSLMQVVPLALGVVSESVKEMWIGNIGALFPTNSAGAQFYAYLGPNGVLSQFNGGGALQLSPVQGFWVVFTWMTVLLVAAFFSFACRDL